MKNKTIAYFPEPPPERFHPQLLAVEHQGSLYKLQVETFHLYENAVPAQNPSEHSHDVFHIVLYRAGDNIFKLAGRQRRVRPGTLVLVHPGVPHCFAPMLFDKSVYHEVTFSFVCEGKKLAIPFTDLFSKYYGNELKSEQMLVDLNTFLDAQIEDIYLKLNEDFSKYDSANSFPVYQHLGNMFDLLFENIFCPKTEESDKPRIKSRLHKTRTHIEQNLHDKLSLRDLSKVSRYVAGAFLPGIQKSV